MIFLNGIIVANIVREMDVMNQSHILIVEDERDIAVAIEAYLSNQGIK